MWGMTEALRRCPESPSKASGGLGTRCHQSRDTKSVGSMDPHLLHSWWSFLCHRSTPFSDFLRQGEWVLKFLSPHRLKIFLQLSKLLLFWLIWSSRLKSFLPSILRALSIALLSSSTHPAYSAPLAQGKAPETCLRPFTGQQVFGMTFWSSLPMPHLQSYPSLRVRPVTAGLPETKITKMNFACFVTLFVLCGLGSNEEAVIQQKWVGAG